MSTAKRFVAKNGLDNNNQTITNTASPVNDSDVATRGWVVSNTAIANSATKLATSRAITISGDATGTANFDGTADVNIAVTLQTVIANGTSYILGNTSATALTAFKAPINRSGGNLVLFDTEPKWNVATSAVEHSIVNSNYPTIETGITHSGAIYASYSSLLRNAVYDNDNGILNSLYNTRINYGHISSANAASKPLTTTATGLYIVPYKQSGTITTSYGINLAVPQTGNGFIGTHYGIYDLTATTSGNTSWSIYSAGGANNYFNGTVTIGTASNFSSGNKLHVSGSANVDGNFVTTGSLTAGNATLGDPNTGTDAHTINGTAYIAAANTSATALSVFKVPINRSGGNLVSFNTQPIWNVATSAIEHCIVNFNYPTIETGITHSGFIYASYSSVLRNVANDNDNGILNFLNTTRVNYGHHSSANAASKPLTTTATGLYIVPYKQSGTITTSYGINLAVPQTGNGFIGTHYGIYDLTATTSGNTSWSIYSAGGANNYFNGTVTIGTASNFSSGNKLHVSGSANVDGNFVTTGTLTAGNDANTDSHSIVGTTAFNSSNNTATSVNILSYPTNLTTGTKYNLISSVFPKNISNSPSNLRIDYSILALMHPTISTGIVHSGTQSAGLFQVLRNISGDGDEGTLTSLQGVRINYGNHSSANVYSKPLTTSSLGLYLQPYKQSGTITNSYGINLAVPSTGNGFIGTHIGIYDQTAPTSGNTSWGYYGTGGANNYFNGTVTIGTASNFSSGNKLHVNGNANVDGNFVTTGSLTAGNATLGDPNTGTDAHTINGTAYISAGNTSTTTLYVSKTTTNQSGSNYNFFSTDSPYYYVNTAATETSAYCLSAPTISSGITSTGAVYGIMGATIRNSASDGDNGTLANLYGLRANYGHDSTANAASKPLTTTATGLYIQPYKRSGTITSSYGIHVAIPQTGTGFIGTHYGIYDVTATTSGNTSWSIYSAGGANNYFNGTVSIGSTSFSSAYKLYVTGNQYITGTFGSAITSTNPTAGVGYATGAGGTVVQTTNKANTVLLNTVCGTIITNAAALASNTGVGFTLNNSAIAATDLVVCALTANVATTGSYAYGVDNIAAGSCRFFLRNLSTGSLSEAVNIRYSVIKSVNA